MKFHNWTDTCYALDAFPLLVMLSMQKMHEIDNLTKKLLYQKQMMSFDFYWALFLKKFLSFH